jgi:hypothetical protein
METDNAISQLEAALQDLQAAARNSMDLCGDEILSGAEFCELDGELDVFEELSDDQILTMVQTDNADIVCSDEDEQDTCLTKQR